MTKESLIKQLETACYGLDPVDPLRLLVDDVIAALAQTERTWVGLTDEEIELAMAEPTLRKIYHAIEAKLKEKNT
jgi:hypothetical protein